jgi:hypothetical protein
MADVTVAYTGWGTETWGYIGWGQSAFNTGAMTLSQGNISLDIGTNVSVSGLSLTSYQGSVSTGVEEIITPEGISLFATSGTVYVFKWSELPIPDEIIWTPKSTINWY